MLNLDTTFDISKTLAAFDISIEKITTARLTNDSRKVKENDVFCAVIGTEIDGRQFIEKAIESGAALVIAQCHHKQQHGNKIHRKVTLDNGNKRSATIVQFYQLADKLAEFSSLYYQTPQKKLTLIGVTGTNGKTSTSQIIARLLSQLGKKSAVIGTTGAGEVEHLQPLANTTPGPTELMQLMAEFVKQNISHVAMEVSSHALDQGRFQTKDLAVAIFTNLSRDHLDYHQTMEEYAAAKFAIFSNQPDQVAVINADDEYGKQWLSALKQPCIAFGMQASVKEYDKFVHAENIKHTENGMTFTVTTQDACFDVDTQLLGDFNVENLIASIACIVALDVDLPTLLPAIANVKPSDGRMETFNAPNKPTTVVDYAHTPDALKNALVACRRHCEGALWVVFGCGGDRDKGKRAQMGAIAQQYADHVVITNDNPRSEAPELIANDILSGCTHTEKITVMLDRKQAVRSSIAHAKANDLVLLAGKGHENNIEIAGKVIEYSERAVVNDLYQVGES